MSRFRKNRGTSDKFINYFEPAVSKLLITLKPSANWFSFDETSILIAGMTSIGGETGNEILSGNGFLRTVGAVPNRTAPAITVLVQDRSKVLHGWRNMKLGFGQVKYRRSFVG